jgi:alkylation response protein AidB-like acyl-CoA dehydrogenase
MMAFDRRRKCAKGAPGADLEEEEHMTNLADEDLLQLREMTRAQLDAHADTTSLWESFVSTGLTSLLLDDSTGDSATTALATVAHELGYGLSSAPFTASAGGASSLLRFLEPNAEVESLSADIAAGAVAVLAVPHTHPFFEWPGVHTVVADGSSGATASGRIASVMSGAEADILLVPLVRDGQVLVAAVRTGAGVQVRPDAVIDPTRQPATIALTAAPYVLLAAGEEVSVHLRRALGIETLSVAAEMVGAAQAALDEINAFVAQRKAFGHALGTFQAVRHRCVDRMVDIEAAGALIAEAASLLDDPRVSSEGLGHDVAVVLAKTAAEVALREVANESILLRGAFGFTWEGGGHRFMRRWLADNCYRGTSLELSVVLDEAIRSGDVHAPAEDEFTAAALAWLAENAPQFEAATDAYGYFPDLTEGQIQARLERARAWERRKADAGWAGISVPVELGGRGGSPSDEARFVQLEHRFALPRVQFEITSTVVLPTLLNWAGEPHCREHIPRILRGDELWCQMTSEPEAGSDLAMISTRATRTEDGWEVNGRKIWISGAQFAEFGLLLARTDPNAPKHKGLSAFIVPMDAPGIRVDPIRQATGSNHFCEVQLDHVRLPDSALVGEPGEGWKIMMATIAFERLSLSGSGVPFGRVFELAGAGDATAEQRLRLRDLLLTMRELEALTRRSLLRAEGGVVPGSETSVNKLLTGRAARQSAQAVELMLGSAFADNPEWLQFVLGSVGLRIGGGTEEIQRDVLADRVLGLPTAPRGDPNTPWAQLARS